ncbi:MAG: aldo/keto reductase [Thermoplasmataceae archaeon]
MKYLKYGKSGIFVSEIALGAMTFGDKNSWKLGGLSQQTANEMVRRAYAYGINLFDTADVYDEGESEIALGIALKGFRDEVHIATKVRGKTGNGINNVGLSRSHISRSVKGSMKRLNTDYIDIYQFHSFDYQVPYDETIEAMQDLVERGGVFYPGVSNFNAWQMAVFNAVARENGYEHYQSAQMNYSLLNRDIEHEILPYMKHEDMTLLAWSPLHGGVLTGKYSSKMELKPGTRMGDRGFVFPRFDEKRYPLILSEMEKIAAEQGCSVSNVALSWLRSKKVVIILGARTLEQFEENMKCVEVNLTTEQVKSLDMISEDREQYPNWMIGRMDRGRTFETA